MKELDPRSITNRDTGLTPPGVNPYANNGEKSMPESTTESVAGLEHEGGALPPSDTTESRKPQEWQSQYLLNPTRGPAHIPLANESTARKLLEAWEAHHKATTGKDPTDDERQTYMARAQSNIPPTGYNPAPNQDAGLILTPRDQLAQDQRHQREMAERWREQHPDTTPLKFIDGGSESFPPDVIDRAKARKAQIERDEPGTIVELKDLLLEEAAKSPNERIKGGMDEIKFEKDIYGRKINCAEALAEEIMNNDPLPEFQLGGEYALLKPVIDENGQKMYHSEDDVDDKGRKREIMEFQPDNFIRWVRHWMMYHHGEAPDADHNFAQLIGVHRDQGAVTLQAMLANPSRYFRSDHYKDEKNQWAVYESMIEQVKKELWLFGESRNFDLKYRLLLGNEEKLPAEVVNMFYLNTFTKSVWEGKSSLYHIMTLPQEFKDEKFVDSVLKGGNTFSRVLGNENQADKSEQEKTLDPRVGRALELARGVYYNISDRAKLEEILGKEAPLLNPELIFKQIDLQMDEDKIPPDQRATYIDPKMLQDLRDPQKGPSALMNFINVFNSQDKPIRVIRVVRSLIQKSIEENLDVKGANAVYADTFAFTMARWTGAAARNDVNVVGYDALTRILDTDGYRNKLLDPSRGGAFGNPYTMKILKQLAADFVTATQVEAMAQLSETDKELYHKQLYEVFNEMQGSADDKAYFDAASQLVFPENTMRAYATDHLNRAFTMYAQIMKTEEIKLDKFTSFDYIRGVTFERGAFEEALKEKFFKPMRYGYSTYAQINFAKKIRARMPDKNGEKYRDVHLADAMFGREVLDIPEFRVKGREGISIKSSQEDWEKKINWDYLATKDGKVALWRRVALTRIAAELFTHRDAHSTDPNFNIMYYEQVIKALESIPADIMGEGMYNMKNSKAVGSFFTKEEIKWLRKKSNTEVWRMAGGKLLKDIVFGVGKGVAQSGSQIVKQVSKA